MHIILTMVSYMSCAKLVSMVLFPSCIPCFCKPCVKFTIKSSVMCHSHALCIHIRTLDTKYIKNNIHHSICREPRCRSKPIKNIPLLFGWSLAMYFICNCVAQFSAVIECSLFSS